jgi:hypothetical protein
VAVCQGHWKIGKRASWIRRLWKNKCFVDWILKPAGARWILQPCKIVSRGPLKIKSQLTSIGQVIG